MAADQPDTDDLHFWSFVDYAIERAAEELPDIDTLAMRAVFSLHRTANMIAYDFEATVHRPLGLTWPGFRVLFVVWLAGPLEAKKVAELSGMSRAAVSALVGTLERDGLVVKDKDPRDRRALRLDLTAAGRQVITSAFRAQNDREQEWAGSLSDDEKRTLVRLLGKITGRSARIGAKQRS